jgi:hypothetical protein
LVYFSPFWYVVPRKIWQPWSRLRCFFPSKENKVNYQQLLSGHRYETFSAKELSKKYIWGRFYDRNFSEIFTNFLQKSPFLKIHCYHPILAKTSSILNKKLQFVSPKFSAKISIPGRMTLAFITLIVCPSN